MTTTTSNTERNLHRLRTSERGELMEVDGWVFAILRRDANEWHVLESSMFDGIAGLEAWRQKYPVIPRAIFERVGLAAHVDEWDDSFGD